MGLDFIRLEVSPLVRLRLRKERGERKREDVCIINKFIYYRIACTNDSHGKTFSLKMFNSKEQALCFLTQQKESVHFCNLIKSE